MFSVNSTYIFATICICSGLLVTPILNTIGIMSGQPAVDYYAEVHQSFWNSLIHTAFMPLTYMGVNIAVPALFNLAPLDAMVLQMYVFGIYVTHYATINPLIAILVGMWYIYPVLKAYDIYSNTSKENRRSLVWKGILISAGALTIQETVGHWMGGDDPSRFEGVMNAILYAKYYSVGHFFG